MAAPSSGSAARFPHIYEEGKKVLRSEFGLHVIELPNATADSATLHANPRLRADDLNRAFADPAIRGIFTTIGGDDSVRILPYLDLSTVKDNPKLIMGFSDATTFLSYFASQGMVTLYGPSLMAGFSQLRAMPEEFRDHLHYILFEKTEHYEYRPYRQWSEGYPDWGNPDSTGTIHALQENDDGWHWLQATGAVSGRLWGGCIEVLEFMKGTSFWPRDDFFDRIILLLETSEEKPTVSQVTYMLRNYGMQGVLARISALLIGRPMRYSRAEKVHLDAAVLSVVNDEFERADLPIVTNMDFGHTDPQLVFPLGAEIEVDCNVNRIRLMESVLQ